MFSSHVPPSVSFSSSGLCPSWDEQMEHGRWLKSTVTATVVLLQTQAPAASLVAQRVKNLPAIQEPQVQSLDEKDPLEEGMATHSSILPWRIPRTEEPGWLQSMGSQRVGHDWVTNNYSAPTTELGAWQILLLIQATISAIAVIPILQMRDRKSEKGSQFRVTQPESGRTQS